MNQRRTEPEEDEKVPTEDGEVQAEPVEMQGEVREEPVDWTEDGEDMELVEQLGDLGQDDQENTKTEHLKLDENLDVKN